MIKNDLKLHRRALPYDSSNLLHSWGSEYIRKCRLRLSVISFAMPGRCSCSVQDAHIVRAPNYVQTNEIPLPISTQYSAVFSNWTIDWWNIDAHCNRITLIRKTHLYGCLCHTISCLQDKVLMVQRSSRQGPVCINRLFLQEGIHHTPYTIRNTHTIHRVGCFLTPSPKKFKKNKK